MRIPDAFDLFALRALFDPKPRSGRRAIRGCEEKVQFEFYDEAFTVSARYSERVVLQFGEFGPYWCRGHNAWHVGHRGKRDALLRAMEWIPSPMDGGAA